MSKIPSSINSKRINKEQRQKLIEMIDQVIELRKRELAIFERMAKQTKRHIQMLKDIKKGRVSLHYFLRNKQQ